MNSLKALWAILILAALFTSCAKKGPQVEQGPVEPKRPTDARGPYSNLNVQIVTIKNFNLSIGDNYIEVPEITQNILDSGYVNVSLGKSSFDWSPLPFNNDGISVQFNSYVLGQIYISSSTQGPVDFRIEIVRGH